MLSIDPVLKIFVRRGGDAVFSFGQKIGALAEDHRSRGTNGGTGWLLVFVQAVVAELALDDLRIEVVPLELGHIEGAGHLAIAAAYAERTIPCNRTPVGFF
jgi:hypothetical protein